MSFSLLSSVLFLCLMTSVSWATQFKDCGSELGTIQSLTVTDCPTVPCKFLKGSNYSMNLTFVAKAPSSGGTIKVYGIIAGIPVPFNISDSNACDHNCKCPIQQNDVNVAQLTIPVLRVYPSISLYVKVEIMANDQKQDYLCLEFPATITGSLIAKENEFI